VERSPVNFEILDDSVGEVLAGEIEANGQNLYLFSGKDLFIQTASCLESVQSFKME